MQHAGPDPGPGTDERVLRGGPQPERPLQDTTVRPTARLEDARSQLPTPLPAEDSRREGPTPILGSLGASHGRASARTNSWADSLSLRTKVEPYSARPRKRRRYCRAGESEWRTSAVLLQVSESLQPRLDRRAHQQGASPFRETRSSGTNASPIAGYKHGSGPELSPLNHL